MTRSVLALLCTLLFAVPSFGEEIIKPEPLRPGDTIAIVTPARGIDAEKRDYVKQRLEEMGYKVWIAPNIHDEWGYLAGSDEVRARTFMDPWRMPEVKAIFCGTGGYGVTRLLDDLDYDVIRQNPKILTGFSDITGLHLAIQRKTGVVTFHSPTSSYAYGDDRNERAFQSMHLWELLNQSEAARIPMTLPMVEPSSPVITLRPGTARGRLTGGNLSLIHALMGTPYEMETEGRILFIEDVGEEPYRIDRMLSNLQLAGKLDEVSGVVLGLFADCEAKNPERSFTLEQVLDQYFGKRPYPVVKNFPVGHVIENVSLPVGVMAELDATRGTVTLLESPFAGKAKEDR